MDINDGFLDLPSAPGLGVSIDEELLAEAHERYLRSDIRERRDAEYVRRSVPEFDATPGTWTIDKSGWSG